MKKINIHRAGYKTIFFVWILCLLAAAALVWIHCPKAVWIPVTVLLAGIMMFIAYFFRVPKREININDSEITSVADGRVVIAEKVFEDEYLHRECIQVSIFMDFFDVHVNFWPVTGKVTYYKYHPGRYLLAFMPKASELNEHSSIAVQTADGHDIFFRQIAGTFARRIETYGSVGEAVTKGRQCGIIKFGSRIDMFLPLDTVLDVAVGDEVSACETVIAHF